MNIFTTYSFRLLLLFICITIIGMDIVTADDTNVNSSATVTYSVSDTDLAITSQPVYFNGFEDYLTGQSTQEIRRLWGSQCEDFWYVTNVNVASGDKALTLVHRRSDSQWGWSMPLTKLTSGQVEVSFKFSMIGTGASFGIELRDSQAQQRWLNCSVVNGRLRYWVNRRRFDRGQINQQRWYQLTLLVNLDESVNSGDTENGQSEKQDQDLSTPGYILTDLLDNTTISGDFAPIKPVSFGTLSIYLSIYHRILLIFSFLLMILW